MTMRRNLLGLALLLAAPFTLAAATASMDQDRDQDQDRIRLSDQDADKVMDQIRDRLHDQDGVPNKELRRIEREMYRYVKRGGDTEPLRTAVRTGYTEGCKDECLQEMVRTMNQARAWGMGDQESSDLVCNAVREMNRARNREGKAWTDTEMGDQVRDRAQTQLRSWERLQDQEMLMEHDREMRREMQREMQREQQREMEKQGEGQKGRGGQGT